MSIKSEKDIYRILEEQLRAADQPLTCNDLWDASAELRQEAKEEGPNGVSDKLGFMWRKGLLVRYPAPRTSTSFARYAYTWKPEDESNVVPIKGPDKPLVAKRNIEVSETKDGVVIELDNVTITVKTR
jgi:hypothetical protein